jgi:TPR repeat protein
MIQSQYVTGILYTDNLIVKRDLNYAYYWIKKSSREEYEPAKDVINQIESRISQSVVDSITRIEEGKRTKFRRDQGSDNKSSLTSPVDLVFIDFDAIGDTITEITDSMLIQDLGKIGIDSLLIQMKADTLAELVDLTTSENIKKLSGLAENGSPEALTILGRLHEQGTYFDKNMISAAAFYLRALRLDSPKAPYLLWQMSKSQPFLEELQYETKNEDAKAMFVWYGLNSVNYDNQLAISDAVNLLQYSANANYIPAMIEMGLNNYTGRYIIENKQHGLQLWQNAVSLGSTEAAVRLLTATLYGGTKLTDPNSVFKELKKAADNGSVLAQVTLAYCYQNGIGTAPSKSETVNYYRAASNRGSRYAYRELQRLYDEIRPDEPEFVIN